MVSHKLILFSRKCFKSVEARTDLFQDVGLHRQLTIRVYANVANRFYCMIDRGTSVHRQIMCSRLLSRSSYERFTVRVEVRFSDMIRVTVNVSTWSK